MIKSQFEHAMNHEIKIVESQIYIMVVNYMIAYSIQALITLKSIFKNFES